MTTRRGLAGLLALPATAQTAAPADYRWRVMRSGSEIGSHTVRFRSEGGNLVAMSEVLVVPRVLGVVVYRYEHRYTEVTRQGRFVSVQSRLNRNGRIVEVAAEAGAGAPPSTLVRGTDGERRLPAEAAPLSWWEPRRFGGGVPIFGTTTGQIMDLRWTREALAGGAVRWRCAGEVEAVLEYSALGRWLTYSVVGDDGTPVSYEPA